MVLNRYFDLSREKNMGFVALMFVLEKLEGNYKLY
jgi:hypothetical protein